MIEYKEFDVVIHPKWGRCSFGGYLDDECREALVWDGRPWDCIHLVNVNDLAVEIPEKPKPLTYEEFRSFIRRMGDEAIADKVTQDILEEERDEGSRCNDTSG